MLSERFDGEREPNAIILIEAAKMYYVRSFFSSRIIIGPWHRDTAQCNLLRWAAVVSSGMGARSRSGRHSLLRRWG